MGEDEIGELRAVAGDRCAFFRGWTVDECLVVKSN